MKRIDRKTREQAAHIVAVMASDWTPLHEGGWPEAARKLAIKARLSPSAVALHSIEECWAEAEALLRTGWSPT